MPKIKSAISPSSEEFKANAAAMATLVEDLNMLRDKAALGGSKSQQQKHLERGKLLPRERVNA